MRSDQNNSLWTTPTRPEHTKRPDSGRSDNGQSAASVQSTPSVQLWTPPNRPEQTQRPESGRSDTGQSNSSVKILDAILITSCIVFC
jgi:hypothetical protein